MKEFNNIVKAKQYAEYITSKVLRQYVADKVTKYLGENSISVFDGCAGSGQLCQYLDVNRLIAVEIQPEACKTLKENYPNAVVYNQDFLIFRFSSNKVDCTVMNPPFSVKFKELTSEQQSSVQSEFSWKNSGVIDGIFILKSLQYTERFGVYIIAAGVGYRKTEAKFRELIGNQLAECCLVDNGFDDTSITVMVLVIDKQKTNNTCHFEKYDCKKQLVEFEYTDVIEDTWRVQDKTLAIPTTTASPEELNSLNNELVKSTLKSLDMSLKIFRTNDTLRMGDTKVFDIDTIKYCDYVIAIALRHKREILTEILQTAVGE